MTADRIHSCGCRWTAANAAEAT